MLYCTLAYKDFQRVNFEYFLSGKDWHVDKPVIACEQDKVSKELYRHQLSQKRYVL